jgi:hypothetical protein
MTIEAMKQALVALENGKRVRACEGGTAYQPDLEDNAIESLRQAIEQWEKQAPTKIFGPNLEEILNGAGFYRRREWVKLTEQDRHEAAKEFEKEDLCRWSFDMGTRAAEAKLKEKNA